MSLLNNQCILLILQRKMKHAASSKHDQFLPNNIFIIYVQLRNSISNFRFFCVSTWCPSACFIFPHKSSCGICNTIKYHFYYWKLVKEEMQKLRCESNSNIQHVQSKYLQKTKLFFDIIFISIASRWHPFLYRIPRIAMFLHP